MGEERAGMEREKRRKSDTCKEGIEGERRAEMITSACYVNPIR